ncbi:uncharacterized protein LOC119655336 isoform X3 [Hermetia illucens]|uniref:uncharacterized protein LOC119655336 isoform X3 n=1 Tax=Hermetia illucens TaxID=343691 RepID=UPI0018CC77E2|nr:uncharacterized protein LOC119655336 isoform X3 [Hermetia illucens]
MVNKQYPVQKQQQNSINSKHYSPPPVRNPSMISNTPNPINNNQLEDSIDFTEQRKRPESVRVDKKTGKAESTTYEKNITLGHKIFGSQNVNQASKSPKDNLDEVPRFMQKDPLEINDIGRFQYILQMDKEMAKHPDRLSRTSSRVQIPSSRSSSINSSSNHLNFWKAGSESAMTTSSSDFRRHEDIHRYLQDFWKYAKWPLLVILCAILLGTSIYFLVTDADRPMPTLRFKLNSTERQTSKYNSIEGHIIQEEEHITNGDLSEEEKFQVKDIFDTTESRERTSDTTVPNEQSSVSSASTILKDERMTNPTTYFRTKPQFENPTTEFSVTTVSPSRNTQILQIYTHAGLNFEEDLKTTTEKMNANKETNVEPTKDTFEIIGFTSGHQNNFGIPIEEDERILRILNEELMKHESEMASQTHRPTTDSSIYRPRVSPTLPVISRGSLSTTENSAAAINNYTDVGNCASTSLSICRGILQYDLTVNSSRKALTPLELEHFKYLFDSKCSSRAAEFVCSALEPECRPSQMGILRPCKRICKSILEPCASVIASSEVLTTTFDCDSYPDSSDRNVCEDPTRRGRCHDNEFKCLDSSCIPLQWKCDNIKDCSLGEDEENCLLCEHEEFRCQSNDKCIPDKWRCDQYNDCPDGSDEADCYDYDDEAGNPDNERLTNPREFSFASVQEPNSPKNKPYLTISSDDSHLSDESELYDDRFLPTAPDNDNDTNDTNQEESGEIQKGEASGRVVIGVPKNIVRTEELTPGPNQCPNGELRCVSGKCITVEQLCDKTIDCPDGADEAMCVYKEAPSTLS